jgi:hypothetical protein
VTSVEARKEVRQRLERLLSFSSPVKALHPPADAAHQLILRMDHLSDTEEVLFSSRSFTKRKSYDSSDSFVSDYAPSPKVAVRVYLPKYVIFSCLVTLSLLLKHLAE